MHELRQVKLSMRLAYPIVVVFCLGLLSWGVVCPQQEDAGSVNATGQAAESAAKKEPPAEQEKESQVAPQTEPKTLPKTESPQTETKAEPKTETKAEPKTELQPTETKAVPKAESQEAGPETQPAIQPTIGSKSAETKTAPTKKTGGASTGASGKRHSAAKHAAAITAATGPRKVVVTRGRRRRADRTNCNRHGSRRGQPPASGLGAVA